MSPLSEIELKVNSWTDLTCVQGPKTVEGDFIFVVLKAEDKMNSKDKGWKTDDIHFHIRHHGVTVSFTFIFSTDESWMIK